MIRLEVVVDTKEELATALEYYTNNIHRFKVDSLDLFCIEENKTYFLKQRKLKEGKFVFYEEN